MSASRWTSAAGVIFVVAFVSAALFLGEQLGSTGDPDRQFASLYDDEASRRRDILGGLLLGVSGLAFLCFLNGVCASIRTAGPSFAALTWLAFGAGIVVVAMLFAGGAALTSVASSLELSDVFNEDPHSFDPDTIRLATQFGYVLIFLYGGISAALAIGTISIAGVRSRVLPVWTGVVGLVAALLVALSFFAFMPIAALPLWVLLVSVLLLVPREPDHARTQGAAGPA